MYFRIYSFHEFATDAYWYQIYLNDRTLHTFKYQLGNLYDSFKICNLHIKRTKSILIYFVRWAFLDQNRAFSPPKVFGVIIWPKGSLCPWFHFPCRRINGKNKISNTKEMKIFKNLDFLIVSLRYIQAMSILFQSREVSQICHSCVTTDHLIPPWSQEEKHETMSIFIEYFTKSRIWPWKSER